MEASEVGIGSSSRLSDALHKKSPRRLPEALIAFCRRFVNRRQLRFAAQFEAA